MLLLALAALTGVLLDGRQGGEVPRAFVESQEKLSVNTARMIGASANQNLSDLRTAATGESGNPDALLDNLVKNRRWRGAAVLADPSRTLVSARGEQVPAQVLPAGAITDSAIATVVAANGELHLVSAIPLANGRVLVATSAVRLPDAGPDDDLHQSLLLTTTSGEIVGTAAKTGRPAQATGQSQPTAPAEEPTPDVKELVNRAGRASAGGEPGTILGPVVGDAQVTVAYAQVVPAGGRHVLDLAVVAVAHGPTGVTAAGGASIIPAAALVALALTGFLLIRWVLVKPVRRLRSDALGLAGGDLNVAIRRTATPEVDRIAAAFQSTQDKLLDADRDHDRRRRGLSALGAVTIAAALVLGWSGGVAILAATPETSVPQEIVSSLRNQTGRATEALRRSMNDGLADLEAIPGLVGTDADKLRTALDQLMSGQSRYRSVYLVDKDGSAGTPVGRPPLRQEERPPPKSGVRQQNNGGRVPVLFAHVPLRDGKTLIGEFDLVHLAGLLTQAPGSVRLVDANFRTISATGGYVAFEEVTAEGPRRLADLAQHGETAAEVQEGPGGAAIVASAAVYGGEIGKLRWTVIAESPVAGLALPANETHRNALLVALIGALFGLLLYGWHYFALLIPLRRVSAAATQLGDDHDRVVYPQRHDEIGTIAACLEICRQARTQGRRRLGEVRRPRGAATELTELMKAVVEDDGGVDEPATRVAPGNRRHHAASRRRSKIGQGTG